MLKRLLLSVVFGSLAWASQAKVVITVANDPPPLLMFDDIPVGSSNFIDHGIAFFGLGTVQDTTTLEHAQPAGDNSNYMAVEGGQTETVTATQNGPFNGFSIYWGSIDGDVRSSNLNTLAFWDGAKEVYSITGAQLRTMGLSTATGSWLSIEDNEFLTFKGLPAFTAVTMSTTYNAFEFDLPVAPFAPDPPTTLPHPSAISADPPIMSADPPAAPELSTWAMVVAGFACLGYAAFRRNQKDRSAGFTT
jgi:hypothetical protein